MMRRLGSMVYAFIVLMLLFSCAAQAAPFTVNSTADAVDANLGNGVCATAGSVCTLRAAIQEANALAGADTINVPAGTYTLTRSGTDNTAVNGDLDITSTVTITGAGPGSTIINGNGNASTATDRVFDVRPGASASISGVRITGGHPGGAAGGGIYVDGTGANLTLNNVWITSNFVDAGQLGSGLSISNASGAGATVAVTNSLISGNGSLTQGLGGGVFHALQTTGSYTNVTISGNLAQLVGAIYTNVALTLRNCTITQNSAGSGVGGINGTSTISNTIIANNTGGNCSGAQTTGGYNLESTTNTCGFTGTGDQNSVTAGNLNIGVLADNGGPTQTHALNAGSFALDKIASGTNGCGTTVTTDQRGTARPQNGSCDVGAYEYQPPNTCPGNVVTTTSDSGNNSLRECINTANSNPGTTISFNIAGCPGGICTITPTSALPAITANGTIIDGYTQPGAQANTIAAPGATNAALNIELSGNTVGSGNGLRLLSQNNLIKGLVINGGWSIGIAVDAGNNTISGNYFGTNVAGTASSATKLTTALYVPTGTNTIGGAGVGDRNLISGTSSNTIWLLSTSAQSNQILNNYIGTNANGTSQIANPNAIVLTDGASSNTIQGNLISGNSTGIWIEKNTANVPNLNVIKGNKIGTDINGTSAIANGTGIYIFGGATNTTIGGTGAGEANTIAFNTSDGIFLDGAATDGHKISSNSIHSNGGLGIDIGPDGVGTGSGANNNKARPTISSITPSGGNFTAVATVTSGDTIEFFRVNNTASPAVIADVTGSGEGYLYLGKCVDNGACSGPYISAVADANGAGGTVQATLLASGLTSSDSVTATATDAVNGTSEFAANVAASLCPGSVVTTTANTGSGSLRECINYANAKSGADTITFNIAGCPGGLCTISPASALPALSDATGGATIDGYSQTGAVANTAVFPNAMNGTLKIVISGNSSGGADGFTVSSNNNTIKGLVINGSFNRGIYSTGDGNTFAGNYIGTNNTGTAASSPAISAHAIAVTGGSNNNVGGPNAADRNLLSGMTQDAISYTNALTGGYIQGNYVGVDVNGTTDITTGYGRVRMGDYVDSVTIGGTSPEKGNIISGATYAGIAISGASNLYVYGNIIGTGRTRTETTLGNTDRGIWVAKGLSIEPSNITIGGLNANEGNEIAYNGNSGIYVDNTNLANAGIIIQGNILHNSTTYGVEINKAGVVIRKNLIRNNGTGGTKYDGIILSSASATGEKIYQNTIYANGKAGIALNALSSATIKNNLITSNGAWGINNAGTLTALNNNGYFSNTSGTCTGTGCPGTSNITTDPLYVNAAGGDFTLTACASPAANAGVDLGVDQPDLNGATAGNFNGPAPDMGAYESACGAPTTTVGDGTAPVNRSVGRGTANRAVDAFTLATSSGTDTLTALGVTLSGTGAAADVAASGVKIWKDSGTVANEWDASDTQIGSGVSFSGTNATFTGLAESISTTATQYLITYDISATATLGVTLLGTVSSMTVTNALSNNDTTDNALTVAAVSGSVYTDEGTVNIGVGKLVRLIKNGVSVGTDTTDAVGRYAIAASLVAGDPILVYIDNDAAYKGAAITVVNGATIGGLDIYGNHDLITRHDNGGSLTSANMSTALGAYSDTDIEFTVPAGVLTVVSGATLYVPAGHTFAPGANTSLDGVKVLGAFSGGSHTHTITGTWNATSGTFNAGTSTISMYARASNFYFYPGASTYYNVVFDSHEYFLYLGGSFTASGDITLKTTGAGFGTLTVGNYNITANNYSWQSSYVAAGTGVVSVAGNWSKTGGSYFGGATNITFTGSGNSTFTPGSGTHGNVTVNKSNQSLVVFLATNNLVMAGTKALTVTSGIFDLAGRNLDVGAGSTFSNDGTLRLQGGETITNLTNDTNSGTVEYNGAGAYGSLVVGNNYYNLTFNGSGSWIHAALLTVNGNFTIASGTVNSNGNNVTVTGNWLNSATYTSGTNTVTLDGTGQSISGNTTFNNLTKSVASADTLTFAAGSTQTINGTATLNGAAGQLLSLRSATPGARWNFNLAGTKSISYVDVQDSDASGSAVALLPVNPSNSTDSGNNIAWFSVTISGTVYTDEGVTSIGAGKTVRLLRNGASVGTAVTNAAGQYSINAAVSSGDAILLYIDGNDGATTDATTVSVSPGGMVNNVDLYVDHFITRHDNAGSLTNALMSAAKGAYSDTEILYSVAGGNLTVSGAGTETYIPAGHSFAPGGNVTTPAMENAGTFNGGSGSITVNGALTQSGGSYTATSSTTSIAGDFTISAGTFNHNSGALFLGTSSLTINTGAAVLNNVTASMGGSTLTVTGTVSVAGNLTLTGANDRIQGGTLAVAGNVISTRTIPGLPSSATLLLNGSGAQTLSAGGGTGILPGISINKPSGALTLQDTLSVYGNTGWTWTAGTVDAGTSTVDFYASGGNGPAMTVNAGSMSFNNVTITMGPWDLTVTGTMTVNGNLAINSVGYFTGGTIAVAGNVTATDPSGVSSSGTILFNGTGAQTFSAGGGTGNMGGSVNINKASGTLTIQDTLNIWGNWTWIAGTVNAGTSSIVISGTGAKTINSGSMVFNHVSINIAPWDLTITGTVEVGGNFTITSVGLGIWGGTINVGGNLTSLDATVGGTTAITLNGTGAQTITASAADLPNGLITINKASGTATLASNLTLNSAGQDLTITQGTLDLAGYNLTLTGAGDVLTVGAGGTLRLQGGETVTATSKTFSAGSTVIYNGGSTYPSLAAGNTYSNLTFNNATGSWTHTGTLTVKDLTLTAGTLISSGQNISVSGSWSNSGIYTSGANTVTLDGTGQSISGNTTFNNLSKSVAAADTLTFAAGSTTTINGTATLNGASGQLLSLVSASPGTRWNFVLGSGATKAISYVSVTDSDASGSAVTRIPVLPGNSSDGGNNIAWFSITLSGTVYTDEGITNVGAGKTVRLLANGTSVGTAVTNGSGQYSISGTVNIGDAILLYIDGNDGATTDATTVSVSPGGMVNSVDLYVDHLITRHDNGGSLTNALMNAAKGAYSDTEILYSVTGGNLTVGGSVTELYVPTAHGFAPGGDVRTPNMESKGTFDGGGRTIDTNNALTITGGVFTATSGDTYIGGDFAVSAGTFNHNSGTIHLDTWGKTVAIGAATLNNVTVNIASSDTLSVTGTMDVNGNLTLTQLFRINGGTIAVAGNVTTADTTVDGSGTIVIDGTGAQNLNAAGGSGALPAVAINKASGTLTLQDTIEIDGTGGWTLTSGTVNAGTSTVDFQSAGTISAAAMSFNNVTVSAGSGNVITLIGNLDVNGNFTLNQILNITGGSITVAGNLTSTDSAVGGSTPITLDGTGAQTITATGADLPDGTVTINKASGTATLASNLTLNGAGQDLILAAGTLDLSSYNLSVADLLRVNAAGTLRLIGNGTVSYATGTLDPGSTVVYYGTAGPYTVHTASYQNLIFDGAGGTFKLGAAIGALQNLTINAGTLDLSGYNVSVSGTFSNNDTLKLIGSETVTGTMDVDSGTVVYYGAGTYAALVAGNAYYNLTFNGAGSWTHTGALDANGNLTITAGTLNSGGWNVNVAGNWSNSGIYTSGANTVTLDGASQSISGVTTFNNFTKSVAAAQTLTFAAGSTTTINGTATLNGASGQLLSLRSSTPGTRWNFTLPASARKAISYVDVQDSDASSSDVSKKPINPASSINSGNNVFWFLGVISGTVYTDEGVTTIADGATVRLLINGASAGTTTTIGGAWSITPASINAGDAFLAYIDGDATYNGTTVSIASGADLTGFNIYAGHVITRHDSAGALTNANMNTAKGAYVDTDIYYSVTGGNLTVSGAGTVLYVPASHSYSPGNNVTTPAMKSLGTFNGGSGAITNGIFILAGGTFTSTSGTFTVGRVAASETFFTVSGGTFNHNNGTVQFSPATNNACVSNTYTVSVVAPLTLYNINANAITPGSCQNIQALTTSGGAIIATNNFTHTDGYLQGTWEVRGNLTVASAAKGGTGTLTMNGNGAQTYAYTAGGIAPNLVINTSGNVAPAGGTTALKAWLFTLTSGTFTAPSGNFTLGRWVNANETIFSMTGGTFSHNNGTVQFQPSGICAGPTFTVSVAAPLALYNIEANTSNTCSQTSVVSHN